MNRQCFCHLLLKINIHRFLFH
uniref:Uncharacterized protein n=1 Tax=Arundo donax TaxID=35708 RepID=A0A0A9BFQ0_ARUDO